MLKKQHIYDTIIHTETKILKKQQETLIFVLFSARMNTATREKLNIRCIFFIGTRRVRTSLFGIGFIFVGVVFADRK